MLSHKRHLPPTQSSTVIVVDCAMYHNTNHLDVSYDPSPRSLFDGSYFPDPMLSVSQPTHPNLFPPPPPQQQFDNQSISDGSVRTQCDQRLLRQSPIY